MPFADSRLSAPLDSAATLVYLTCLSLEVDMMMLILMMVMVMVMMMMMVMIMMVMMMVTDSAATLVYPTCLSLEARPLIFLAYNPIFSVSFNQLGTVGKMCAAFDPSGALIVCGGGQRFWRPNNNCWQLIKV